MSLSGKFFKSKIKKKQFLQNIQSDVEIEQEKQNTSNQELKPSLEENLKQLKQELGESSDIVYRTIQLTGKREIVVSVIYIDGLGDSKSIQQFILESLSQRCEEKLKQSPLEDEFKIIKDSSISVGEIKTTRKMGDVSKAILSGESVVLIDWYREAIITGTRGWEDRGVTEPSSQTIVRGPKDGFSETLRMNTALIRRRLKDGKLRIEPKNVGSITKTDIAFVYINGIADPKVVEEVHSRLDKIDIDAILESGYIEELIQDETYTPFPTIYSTERPDVMALLWFLTIYFKTSSYCYACLKGLAQLFSLKDYRILTFPFGMTLIAFSMIVYPDTVYALEWDTKTWIPYSLMYGVLLLLFLYIFALVRKRKFTDNGA